MLTGQESRAQFSDALASRPVRPQRVLACILCQQRKIKCDRIFPCSNCTRSRAQCVPATLVPRKRRRRFPERDLLARLRHYEGLLRHHNVEFEPLHPDQIANKESPDVHIENGPDDEQFPATAADTLSPLATSQPEKAYEPKSFWHAMNQGFRDAGDESDSSLDNLQYTAVEETWDRLRHNNSSMFFGLRKVDVDLSPLQPNAVHIFRLWQIYLENVNPLLKITHTPSLQGLIIEAASNTTNISRELEALLFSIYCISITSLTSQECQDMFGTPKQDLLTRFRFGCEQALAKCEFLRTSHRHCLTALFLFLLSAMHGTDPRSVSSIMGLAIRIAQRMGLHSETSNCTYGPLEAEVRRRLWWSLILFDARVCEMSNHKTATLLPIWDCAIPSNVNDSDLHTEMKAPPMNQSGPTEVLFAVVRSEMGNFIRRTSFHLDFTNPALKQLASVERIKRQREQHSPVPLESSSEIDELEQLINEKYLRFCDEQNPLHFMTLWNARCYLARCRLVEIYSHCATHPSTTAGSGQQSPSPHQRLPTDAQRHAAFGHALTVLECDTKVMSSPLVRGYLWIMDHYFPFIAYFQVLQHLRRRPVSEQSGRAWQIMDENYEARFEGNRGHDDDYGPDNSLVQFFAKVVLGAWAAREMVFATQQKSSEPLPPAPRIVTGLRRILVGKRSLDKAAAALTLENGSTSTNAVFQAAGDADMSMLMDFGSHSLPHSLGGFLNYAAPLQPSLGVDTQPQTPFDMGLFALDFSSIHPELERHGL